MTIEIKPEHERTIELAIQSGVYGSREEVLDQAFDILREQLRNEDWMRDRNEELSSHIAVGFAQAEAGHLVDGDDVLRLIRERRVPKE